MSEPKIAWCHRANDNYYTDEEMAENHERIKASYIKFIEFSAYQKAIEALRGCSDGNCILRDRDGGQRTNGGCRCKRNIRETLRELGEIE